MRDTKILRKDTKIKDTKKLRLPTKILRYHLSIFLDFLVSILILISLCFYEEDDPYA